MSDEILEKVKNLLRAIKHTGEEDGGYIIINKRTYERVVGLLAELEAES